MLLITNCMENKYYHTPSEVSHHVAGALIKYSSLMLGVYSVCEDEKDFVSAILGGVGYFVGELLHRRGEQFSDAKNLSKLEETLKE